MQIPEVPYEELEDEVERLARTWDDDLLRRAWSRASAPSAAPRSPTEYGPRFPDYYKANRRLGPDRRRRAERSRS